MAKSASVNSCWIHNKLYQTLWYCNDRTVHSASISARKRFLGWFRTKNIDCWTYLKSLQWWIGVKKVRRYRMFIRVVVACMTDALRTMRGKRGFPAKRETSVKGEKRGWETIKKVQTIARWTWLLLGVSSVGTTYWKITHILLTKLTTHIKKKQNKNKNKKKTHKLVYVSVERVHGRVLRIMAWVVMN